MDITFSFLYEVTVVSIPCQLDNGSNEVYLVLSERFEQVITCEIFKIRLIFISVYKPFT